MKTLGLLALFWVMQGAAQTAFSFGASQPGRWLAGFIIGNTIGVSSIFVLMRLYAAGDAGTAYALAVGGAFVAGQCAVSAVTWQMLALGQWGCVALIAAGMMGYAWLGMAERAA